MDLLDHSISRAPARAWEALRTRGVQYTWHKVLRRTLSRHPNWKRRLLYADARKYWTLRGGDDYFDEQEGQPARTLRAGWIARKIACYQPASLLEVGCGYGKLLGEVRSLLDIPLWGVDFSPTQLTLARKYLGDDPGISLTLGRAEGLPFPDQAFDLVVTSAVILHNPPGPAERIRREVIRVGCRYAVHNEETNQSYNRFGYDTADWYRQNGFELAESGPIPFDSDPQVSQFCVARLSSPPSIAGADRPFS
jgi:SAM-dependent methyltransferase